LSSSGFAFRFAISVIEATHSRGLVYADCQAIRVGVPKGNSAINPRRLANWLGTTKTNALVWQLQIRPTVDHQSYVMPSKHDANYFVGGRHKSSL
jgi:hypothetical protein